MVEVDKCMNELLETIMNTFISCEVTEGYYKYLIKYDDGKLVRIDINHRSVSDKVSIRDRSTVNKMIYIDIHPDYEIEFQQWLRLISV